MNFLIDWNIFVDDFFHFHFTWFFQYWIMKVVYDEWNFGEAQITKLNNIILPWSSIVKLLQKLQEFFLFIALYERISSIASTFFPLWRQVATTAPTRKENFSVFIQFFGCDKRKAQTIFVFIKINLFTLSSLVTLTKYFFIHYDDVQNSEVFSV